MREIDFLGGLPAANLARFALPALGANLLQSADQVVDMLVVGAFVGERGLAALANATMVGFVANSISLGLAVGATVLVSRRLGAGERDAAAARCEGAGDRGRALAYARAGLAVSVGATAAVVLLVQALAPQLVGLFADDPEAVSAGVLYLRACCSANSLAYAAMYALDSFAQATGAPRLAAVNALLDAVAVRVGLAAALVPALGYPGILAAQALSPVLPCAVGAAYLGRYARRVRPEAGAGTKAAS